MREFSYKNRITFIINEKDLNEIIEMVNPNRYNDLYKDIDDILAKERKEEGLTRQDRKEKHPPEIIRGLKELDLKTDILIKKQTANFKLYTVLLPKLSVITEKDKTVNVSLNMMLAYELYSVLTKNQSKTAEEIAQVNDGTHPAIREFADDEHQKNRFRKGLEDTIIRNRKLIHNIFKDFSYAEIHKIRLDYNTLSVVDHFNHCNDIKKQGI